MSDKPTEETAPDRPAPATKGPDLSVEDLVSGDSRGRDADLEGIKDSPIAKQAAESMASPAGSSTPKDRPAGLP